MNVLLLKAWLAEYAPALTGARLRDVRQFDKKSFALQLSGTGRLDHWLLVSVLEAYPVIAILPENTAESAQDVQESGFVKAARFHLAGATLNAVTQEGFDRSVCFEFARQDIYGRETQRTLRVELVGRASNAYLLSDKGMVISLFKPVAPGRNSVRRVVTGKLLPPPPPLGKLVASEGGIAELQRELDESAHLFDPLQEVLTRRIAGGDVELWARLEKLLKRDWSTAQLYEFVSELQRGQFSRELFGDDLNAEVLAAWQAKRQPGKAASPHPSKITGDTRNSQIKAQLMLAERAEELEQLGVEMLQRAATLASRETESAYLKGWQLAHAEWAERISIGKTAEENAGALIEYAQRLKRARPKLEHMLDNAVGVAPGRPETDYAASANIAGRSGATPTSTLARDLSKLERSGVKYMRYVTSDGIPLLVGQSDRSNDELVRHYGSSRHLWLHVRDYPGSHVLLLTNGREVPQRSLEQAAVVAGYYSQGRGELELEVSYTPIKQLRRPKGGKPGQVLKLSEKVIRVNPLTFEAIRDQLRVSSSAP